MGGIVGKSGAFGQPLAQCAQIEVLAPECFFTEEPFGFDAGLPGEAELADHGISDVLHGYFRGIGDEDAIEVFGVDRFHLNKTFADEGEEWLPVFLSHEDEGKIADFAGLDEGRDFKEFIECAEAAGQADEGVGVFDEHDLADEEVAELNEAIDVRIWLLLHGELDVAADGGAVGVFGAAVGGFHDAGPAAGHDGEAGVGEFAADFAGEFVVLVIFLEASGAEDGDARADEVEGAEAGEELCHDAEETEEFKAAGARAFKELFFLRFCGDLAPVIAVRGWVGGERIFAEGHGVTVAEVALV